MNIIGIIPIGGVGKRLNLSFPKQLLPTFNTKQYKPVVSYTVDCLNQNAFVKQIIFLHGSEYKEQVRSLFQSPNYIHILESKSGFANTLLQAKNYIDQKRLQYDGIYYALPDTIYYPNPFIFQLQKSSTFNFLSKRDEVKVDRINRQGKYDVKSPKSVYNSSYHWGSFFLTRQDFNRICHTIISKELIEIGHAINQLNIDYLYLGNYFDLGTWESVFDYYKFKLLQQEQK